jgi:hypothetical protein
MDFLGPAIESYAQQRIADEKIRRTRKRAEVMEGDVFAQHLVLDQAKPPGSFAGIS